MGRLNVMKSAVLVVGVFSVLLILGTVLSSQPSQATQDAGRTPTTTTTSEPPPEGVVVVRLANGSFRPSNLRLDLDVAQIVQWINEDDRDYVLSGSAGLFEAVELGPGATFEFDFSTVDPAIHRYSALIGFQRIPGSVDSRPAQ